MTERSPTPTGSSVRTPARHPVTLSALSAKPDAPLIVDVARYRLEDGPGIRSVVFFKGCGLRCSFCQNPETQGFSVEICDAQTRCIRCGACVAACPELALQMEPSGVTIRKVSCRRCGACADACPSGNRRRIGMSYTPAELAEILLRDRHFYAQSGGGVTLSGGEPALFPDYLAELLPLLRAQGVHVLLETGGHFPGYERFRTQVLPYIDVVDFSLKVIDLDAHREMAGHDNRLVLENLRRFAQEPRIVLQASIPLVPGVTDTEANLRGMAMILHELAIRRVRLLPYNPLGVVTRRHHAPRGSPPTTFMSPEGLRRATDRFHQLLRQVCTPKTAENA